MAYRDNYLDLDPTYKDVHGQPLLRMTFDLENDLKMSLRHRQGDGDRPRHGRPAGEGEPRKGPYTT
jgi:hypothetical protein